RQTLDGPRYRVLLLLDRTVSPAEYEGLALAVMRHPGIEQFDRGSAEAEGVMFQPPTRDPATYERDIVDGDPLAVQLWLADAPAPVAPESSERPPADLAAPAPYVGTPGYAEHVQRDVAWTLAQLDELAALEHDGDAIAWPGAEAN